MASQALGPFAAATHGGIVKERCGVTAGMDERLAR
jgi:hypothetical protein